MNLEQSEMTNLIDTYIYPKSLVEIVKKIEE